MWPFKKKEPKKVVLPEPKKYKEITQDIPIWVLLFEATFEDGSKEEFVEYVTFIEETRDLWLGPSNLKYDGFNSLYWPYKKYLPVTYAWRDIVGREYDILNFMGKEPFHSTLTPSLQAFTFNINKVQVIKLLDKEIYGSVNVITNYEIIEE